MIQLECLSEDWCLPLNLNKYKALFFSVDPHQAILQPHLFLFNSPLRFIVTQTFLGVTFGHTLSFSKYMSLLKAKFFPRLNVLHCISASSWGPLKSPYPCYTKRLFTLSSLMLHSDNFFFLSLPMLPSWNAFTSFLSSSPIPLLLSEFPLPSL